MLLLQSISCKQTIYIHKNSGKGSLVNSAYLGCNSLWYARRILDREAIDQDAGTQIVGLT